MRIYRVCGVAFEDVEQIMKEELDYKPISSNVPKCFVDVVTEDVIVFVDNDVTQCVRFEVRIRLMGSHTKFITTTI